MSFSTLNTMNLRMKISNLILPPELPVEPNTMTLWLDFSDQSIFSGSIFIDKSGYENHCSITGSYTYLTSYINVPNVSDSLKITGPVCSRLTSQNEYSIEIVCNPPSQQSTFMRMYSTVGLTDMTASINIPYYNIPVGSMDNIIFDANRTASIIAANRISYTKTMGTKSHYVFVYRQNASPYSSVFENGTLKISKTTAFQGSIMSPSTTLRSEFLRPTNLATRWTGDIYYIKIYNYALSNTEITNLYLSSGV